MWELLQKRRASALIRKNKKIAAHHQAAVVQANNPLNTININMTQANGEDLARVYDLVRPYIGVTETVVVVWEKILYTIYYKEKPIIKSAYMSKCKNHVRISFFPIAITITIVTITITYYYYYYLLKSTSFPSIVHSVLSLLYA
jgi:hypothetical protein